MLYIIDVIILEDIIHKKDILVYKMGFSHICDPPRFFFKNRALSLSYPYGALTAGKKLEKSLERFSEKSDYPPAPNSITNTRFCTSQSLLSFINV